MNRENFILILVVALFLISVEFIPLWGMSHKPQGRIDPRGHSLYEK